MNHQLGQLAQTDFLSGLYNRRFLDEAGESRLYQNAQNREGVYLMMLDLDDFKQYNDHYMGIAKEIKLSKGFLKYFAEL